MWWDLETFLKNPNHIDKEFFSECLEVADLLGKYKITEESYSSFFSGMEEVRIGYEEVCRQYDLLCQHRELFAFSEDGYVDHERKREIVSKSADLLEKITLKKYLSEAFDRHTNLDEVVKKHNQEYFERAKKDQLFDDINGRSLDEEQRKAVLTDEKSVLVVAGAGSGKTLTICGKVEYLLKKEGVNPND
ncbi:MAG: UvrD-helicase domain-containing protein, partial [Bacilli bacterium]|nr:UvrD-helicase domain-containing protein [Bacilli bacterium]